MKILLNLVIFLLALTHAYEDFNVHYTANDLQTDGAVSSATCDVTLTYVDATTTLSGIIDCIGLNPANVTSMHIHYVTSNYIPITANSGGILITISVEPVFPMVIDVPGITASEMSYICQDGTYLNIHTDSYPGGELRANFVGMTAYCNVGSLTAPQLEVFGSPPVDGGIQPWAAAYIVSDSATSPSSTGSCFAILTWDPEAEDLTVAGNCSGLSSTIESIRIYNGQVLLVTVSDSPYSFDNNVYFSFTVSVSDYIIAIITTQNPTLTFVTQDNSAGEVQTVITGAFPVSTANCKPWTDPTPAVPPKCYVGSKSSSAGFTVDTTYQTTCTSGEICGALEQSVGGITSSSVYACYSPSICYLCQNINSGGFMITQKISCCSGDLCNCPSCNSGSTIFSSVLIMLIGSLVSFVF